MLQKTWVRFTANDRQEVLKAATALSKCGDSEYLSPHNVLAKEVR